MAGPGQGSEAAPGGSPVITRMNRKSNNGSDESSDESNSKMNDGDNGDSRPPVGPTVGDIDGAGADVGGNAGIDAGIEGGVGVGVEVVADVGDVDVDEGGSVGGGFSAGKGMNTLDAGVAVLKEVKGRKGLDLARIAKTDARTDVLVSQGAAPVKEADGEERHHRRNCPYECPRGY